MSSTHTIDNDDPLLFFDALESATDFGSLSSSMPMELGESSIEMGKGKGKAGSSPVPITVRSSALDDYGLSLSPSWSISSSYHEPPGTPIATSSSPTPSSPTFTLGSFTSAWQNSTPELDRSLLAGSSPGRKGKERASAAEDVLPPAISPLTFPPIVTKFDQAPASSGLSLSYPLPSCISESNVPITSPPQATNLFARASPSHQHFFRRRSIAHSRSRSNITVSSMSKLKLKLGSSPSNTLTRKLLSKKGVDPPRPSLDSYFISTPKLSEIGLTDSVPNNEAFLIEATGYHDQLRTKGRSYSSPYPSSILDIISPTSPDLFLPVAILLPIAVTRNYFDEKLPRELKLRVLACLVQLYEMEYQKAIDDGNWTALKAAASKNRWVGKDRAIKQLVKLSQVSKSWRALVFDGQLWATLDLRSFPTIPKSLLSHIVNAGGQFATILDLSGHTHLNASTLLDITDKLTTITPILDSTSNTFTRLTVINLRGCCSVSTRSLHHLLVRSPVLERLCVKGLAVVTNTTCDILAMYCPKLVSLDISRCLHVDAEGVRRMLCAHDWPDLKELNLGGLKNVSDRMMATLAEAVPNLEVLDLTDARQMHNTAIELFVQAVDDQPSIEYMADGFRTRRRVTKLRRLSLSGCTLLTDGACMHLAGSVPELEILEIGGIGEDLKEEGLIRLLETTPMVRKLDLEDASEITDGLLAILTPGVDDPVLQKNDNDNSGNVRQQNGAVVEPGHVLEHLILSYAARLTDDALINLIRRCPCLKALELDNTRIGSNVVKEFVDASRKREIKNAVIVAVDCRSVRETIVKDLISETRPRVGWRSWEARKLRFFDARDFMTRSSDADNVEAEVKQREKDKEKEDIMKTANGQDEMDETQVVLKTFYSWQNVDAVWAAREKRNRRRKANASNDSELTDSEVDLAGSSSRRNGNGRGGMRWWSPSSGRRTGPGSGTSSPNHLEMNGNDGCTIM